MVALSKDGDYGAGCHGMEEFPFSVADQSGGGEVRQERVTCAQQVKKTQNKDKDNADIEVLT